MARGQILPEEGGVAPAHRRGSGASPRAAAGLLRRHPAGECTCPGRRRGLPPDRGAATAPGRGASPGSWQALARGREEIFPVGSLVCWIQWKESQEKPLLPAWSREVCRVVACGQCLLQVSDPFLPGSCAVAAGRFEAASDSLLKRPCFSPPIQFFLVVLFPLSTSGSGVSCSLGTPRPPLAEVHQDRLCGVRIMDAC